MRIDVNPPKSSAEQSNDYRDYYAKLPSDEARGKFICFLKERRDSYGDLVAGKLVQELGERFLTERFKG